MSLNQLGREDAPRAGHKAAYLGELACAGLSIPPGVVLLPEADDTAVAAVADMLGDVPLAVRSSSVAEDRADASFAGQYETVLGVRGPEQLADAVRRCRGSASNARVLLYRSVRAEQPAGEGMAVLVQRLVHADAAGVAFTANPVTGARDETLVSAVRGLGDRLVCGQADPDEWVVNGDAAECRRAAPEAALDEAQVRAITDLAGRVEAHFGQPQDIEWAIKAGVLWLLQARPITALPEPIEPVPVPVAPPPGFWEREASHAPQPRTRLIRSALFGPRNAALKRMFDEFGFLAESLECREIGGWEYIRLVPLGGKERPAPDGWLMPLLIRLVPQMRSRIAQSVVAMRADKPGHFIERWHPEWQPQFGAQIAELRDVPLAALTDDALDTHLEQTLRLLEDGWQAHFLLHGALGIVLADFAFTCRDLLGWEEQLAFEMLNGLSEKSTEPARRFTELARMAGQRPAGRRLLERVEDRTVEQIVEADRDSPPRSRPTSGSTAAAACATRSLTPRWPRPRPCSFTSSETSWCAASTRRPRLRLWPSSAPPRWAPRGGWPSPAGRLRTSSVSSAPWRGRSGPTPSRGQRVLHGQRPARPGPLRRTRTGPAPGGSGHPHPARRRVLPGDRGGARGAAQLLAGDGIVPRSVLDVGAGAAPWSLAVTARASSCAFTALDLPPVLEVTRTAVSAAQREAQYRYLPGDMFDVELGGPYDLVLLGNVCHLFGEEPNRRLRRRLRGAVEPGGRLAIVDVLPAAGPDLARRLALYELSLVLRTACGAVYPFSSYAAWLRADGFAEIEQMPLGDEHGLALVVARHVAERAAGDEGLTGT